MKYSKLTAFGLAFLAAVVLFAAARAVAASGAFTNQPQPFTELYFVNPQQLPARLTAGKPATVKFRTVNHLGTATQFTYRIFLAENTNVRLLKSGSFNLRPGQPITVPVEYTAARANENVELIIELPDQSQTIHFRSKS